MARLKELEMGPHGRSITCGLVVGTRRAGWRGERKWEMKLVEPAVTRA